ncbi:MAG TPA: TonB-dependent receptor, partial [Methylomirabilota bacterium]|nr:TonB-dependent receptor [Methylomirabilota bacterium]
MSKENVSTHQKALQINLDQTKYGTFAEVGAGQEVARWFFRVGGASGTIAKSISAYDMVISDAIYGQAERYVSRHRLTTMLDYEFTLLTERLQAKRGDTTRFFVFADTVAAQSFTRREDWHGWMGVRFQSGPRREASQIIMHVRLWDKENLQQQEALGILGVNLVYAALYHHDDVNQFLKTLLDDLTINRVEVDMIKFSGPAFKDVDNRLVTLRLVQDGLTNAAMFTADGEVVQAAEVLYKKPILVERGSFRPVTNVTLDMLNNAQAQFIQEPGVQGEDLVVLMEMTLTSLTDAGEINHRDFLDRVDILGTLGKGVLISNYGAYFRLAGYLFRYTKKNIGIVMGVPSLLEIFDEKYYADLEGGVLESFGRLFKNDLKLYVYPLRDAATGSIITARNLRVAPHLEHLYAYLLENNYIQSICDYRPEYLRILSRDVLSKIKTGDASWEQQVPPQVAKIIKERALLGYKTAEVTP